MNDADMKIVRVDAEEPLEDETDWEYIDSMTDEEAYQNALDDPDNPPLETIPPGRLKPVIRPQFTRRRLGMSQQEFADAFGFSVRSLQEWEQGRSQPGKTIRTYLQVIAADPEAALRALKREKTA